MENEKNQFDFLTVYYANELARKYSKLTLEEQKVLHLIFSQIKPDEKNPTVFKLNKLDFFNKLELESEDRYNRYRKLIQGLIKKSYFEIKDIKGNETIGVVIHKAKWYKNEPYFEIFLDEDFMPYLEQLVKIGYYTKVNLNSVLKLKSKHSLTLYKWLCSWTDESKSQSQRYIITKDLKELFGLSIDDYVYNGKFNRAHFERKTIKPAIGEIILKTDLAVSFKKNKKGNFVQNYEFTWTQKEENSKKDKKTKLILNKKINYEQNLTLRNKIDKVQQTTAKNSISQEQIKHMLNNIDKDNQVVFDKR